MTQKQISVRCGCGRFPRKILADPLQQYSALLIECDECRASVYIRVEGTSQTFPPLVQYSSQIKENGVWEPLTLFESFRDIPELAWLESERRIPTITSDVALKQYLEKCPQTRAILSDARMRAILHEITTTEEDVGLVQMLMGTEALALGKLCEDITKLECQECLKGVGTRHLCEISHDVKIELFHQQGRNILPRLKVLKRWEKVLSLCGKKTTLVTRLNVTADPVLQSDLWSDCVKQLAMIISFPQTYYKNYAVMY